MPSKRIISIAVVLLTALLVFVLARSCHSSTPDTPVEEAEPPAAVTRAAPSAAGWPA